MLINSIRFFNVFLLSVDVVDFSGFWENFVLGCYCYKLCVFIVGVYRFFVSFCRNDVFFWVIWL